MNMNKYLDIAPEVQQALADGRPVVALESTIISHGMPYPKNVETALLCLLYTSPSPRDRTRSRMPSSA